ncbi:TPA: S24 family peptidase [Vibrio harveyi]
MKTIGSKITSLRESYKLTQKDLAVIANVSEGAVSKWEMEISKPKTKSATLLADYFNITLESLINPNVDIKIKSDTIGIPFYNNVEAAAGFGSEAYDESFEEIYVNAYFIPNPSSTISLKVCGDSMEPFFADDSIVFVDKSFQEVKDGKVYVFLHDGMLRMKVLERIPTGFNLKSYNESYQLEKVDIKLSSISIIGRVIGQIQMYV